MTPEQAARIRNLPEEMRAVRQWCIAGPDRAPYAVSGEQVTHASLHKPEQWMDFESAVQWASRMEGAEIGFMITQQDPWACVDLDVVNEETQRRKGKPIDPLKWTSDSELSRYNRIINELDSYTEVSSGGYGVHIWVRAFIGAGARRQGVEVYSQERFIVCTGNAVRPKGIEDRQEVIDLLVDEIRSQGSDIRTELEEVEPEDTDMEVFEKASTAANADKFLALCEGKWKELGFTSQSEADLALMSMFAFYSKSNEQCRQLFRCTALGQREKAVKNDRYLNYTLEVIRGRQKREAIVTQSQVAMAAELVKELTGGVTTQQQADQMAAQLAGQQRIYPEEEGTLPWPPGNAGSIAQFIYSSSPRPVKEVSIVAALGFLAGVCGKAYSIPQSGLNVYIILVARSGVGKEAMHSGLALLLQSLQLSVPSACRFVDFTDYASGPALRKACAVNNSFVNVSGEWGRKLKRLSNDDRADGPMATLRTAMTDLYQKSGPASLVGGMGYSDKEKDVKTVQGVAYSMIGETTPGTFYDSLTQTMMEDGFLSRFTVVDYNGERPALNTNPDKQVPGLVAQATQGLCQHAIQLIGRHATQQVLYSPEAAAILNAFDVECDAEINSTTDETKRQMWNRAHLKVCRFASLLACADNHVNPVVTKAHAEWALGLIRRDIYIMDVKIRSGDVGNDDVSRERKMAAVLKEYIQEGAKSESYGCPESLKKAHIVPRRYLQIRLGRISCFLTAKNGSTFSIDQTINAMQKNGYLSEVDKVHLAEKHDYHGVAYRIVSLPPIRG
jgi:hypothetical protein